MKINKTILLNILKKEGISSNFKVIYDWVEPSDLSSVSPNIISENNLIFNSKHSASEHLTNYDSQGLTSISTEIIPGISIGLQNNIIVHEPANDEPVGNFLGEDVLYMPNTKNLKNWTVFFDLEINAPQNKNKSTILLTNKQAPTDTSGFVIGINGAGNLFYEFKNKEGSRSARTLLHPLGEKGIIAISKSKDADLASIFVYDPILHKSHGQEFAVAESIFIKDWAIGGTTTHFTTDLEYERFSGNINNFLMFDAYLSKEKIANIFESFYITAYQPTEMQNIATQFPKSGKRSEVKVKDGIEIDKYEYKESEITTSAGTTIKIYDKVPVYKTKYKTVTQFVKEEGTITVSVPTLIPESKVKNDNYILSYVSDKCVLLNEDADVTKHFEIYSCDKNLQTTSKVAKFNIGDSTFKLDQEYSDPSTVHVYVDGLLLEKDVDYEISGKKVKKIQNNFTEGNELIYDVYQADKTYYDFFGYNGLIWLSGHSGKDVYLSGRKLVKGVDYYDYLTFIVIYGDGLPAGRLGIIGRYNKINKTLNITEKYLECTTSIIINEIAWMDGKRVLKGAGYSLTSANDTRNSEHLAPKKTVTVYNNEEGFFNV